MLAPMAGVTDHAMRYVCAGYGAEYAVTEMVSAKALVFEQDSRPSAPIKTASLCIISPDETVPVAVQLFGSEPEFVAEAARLVSTCTYRGFSGRAPAAVDINMGCPVKKVAGNGEGSALMKDPEKIFDIVSACVKASSLPVTVKMRAGWDAEHINAAECAVAAEKAGAKAICVHARTREQFYRPGIIPEAIGSVRAAVSVPVFGNGDITDGRSALDMIAKTGCDGIAVARGAIGNPMIFREIAAALDGESYEKPSPEAVLAAALAQLDISVSDKGVRRGLCECKFTLSNYVTGRRGASSAREKIMNSSSPDEVKEILTDFFTAI